MTSFAELTPELVTAEWRRFKERTGSEEANHLLLGKVLSWCKRHKTTKTLQKFITQQYAIPRLHSHTYICCNLFEIVLESRFPSFTESEYDRLTLSQAFGLSKQRSNLTDAQLAELLAAGIDGRTRLRHRSKLLAHPKAGFIYVMVSSAYPSRSKLGKTRSIPTDRAEIMSRKTVNPEPVVAVWWEHVSDCSQAERELHGLFLDRKVQGTTEWFDVQPREAIEAAMRIGPKFRLSGFQS
jgi:hypothetical protein